jgi:hypothetical protein
VKEALDDNFLLEMLEKWHVQYLYSCGNCSSSGGHPLVGTQSGGHPLKTT